MKICQSCGMPMNDPTLFGKNTDGSVNEEYCIYCYPKGGFITPMKPLKKWLKLAFHL
ncbi:MAG: zinc ribbon domain-containing protein [Clostridia bacterium]|nr:zinc ribbon domain-containing protein [Clostridia bacterium]